MRRLVLDTDIGTDVDDALALALLLGSPEVELLGVTTVYGDTALRARLARRLVDLSGTATRPLVIPGERQTLSGRPVWWAGHEGKLHDLTRVVVDESADAVDWMIETVRALPGAIDLVAVGPLTNVATAIGRDPAFAGRLRSLTIMGGDFAAGKRSSEHNFASDSVAARNVLASGAPTVVTGLDATTSARIGTPELESIAAGGPLGQALAAEIEAFWDFTGHRWNHPHDPVAVLTLLEPQLFTLREEAVAVVSSEDETDGLVRNEAGSVVRVASIRDPDAVVRAVVERICAAGPQVRQPG